MTTPLKVSICLPTCSPSPAWRSTVNWSPHARSLALRRLVPIAVSVYSKNHAPLKGLRVALQPLSTCKYGFSARLYCHLLLISRSMFGLV